jgi:hypothetical protein
MGQPSLLPAEKKRRVGKNAESLFSPIDPRRSAASRRMMLAVETSELIWHIVFFLALFISHHPSMFRVAT